MNQTTQRFARRSGECVRGAEYAASIERPRSNHGAYWIAAILLPILALAAAWP